MDERIDPFVRAKIAQERITPGTISRELFIAAVIRNDPREYIATHADPSRVKAVKNGKSIVSALKKVEVRP